MTCSLSSISLAELAVSPFGLEHTGGFCTSAFCEIEPYCQAVLASMAQHPVHTESPNSMPDHLLEPMLFAADFLAKTSAPQAKAQASQVAAADFGARARIIGEVRPRYVIVENVAMLLSRGLGRVLGDLAKLGYDAEWHCISAAEVGAKHLRKRIWIVAYPGCISGTGRGKTGYMAGAPRAREDHGEERQRDGNAVNNLPCSYGQHRQAETGKMAPAKSCANVPVNALLGRAVHMWPTPRANDAEKRGNFDPTNPRNGLPGAVKIWPTPRAQSSRGSGPSPVGNRADLQTQAGG